MGGVDHHVAPCVHHIEAAGLIHEKVGQAVATSLSLIVQNVRIAAVLCLQYTEEKNNK
jgi:hypothetical protein